MTILLHSQLTVCYVKILLSIMKQVIRCCEPCKSNHQFYWANKNYICITGLNWVVSWQLHAALSVSRKFCGRSIFIYSGLLTGLWVQDRTIRSKLHNRTQFLKIREIPHNMESWFKIIYYDLLHTIQIHNGN